MPRLDNFLLLFSAYRDLRDKHQSLSDEVTRLRLRNEDLESKWEQAVRDLANRDRQIADKFLNPKEPEIIHRSPTPINPGPEPLTPKQWQKRQERMFFEALEKRRGFLQDEERRKSREHHADPAGSKTA